MTYIDPAGKLLAQLPRLAQLQEGGVPTPVNLEVDLSNRCSLGCEWCHFAYTHTRGPLKGKIVLDGKLPGGDLMDTALAFSFLEQIAGKDISVSWTGGGEPTLHPDFDKIIAHAHSLGIRQGIYTHGGHIDLLRAELLKSALDWVYVSLDESDRESYKAHKGVDRFEAACDGIRNLAQAEGPATIGVGMLVTQANYQHGKRSMELARSLGADYVQFRPTVMYEQTHPDAPAENTAWLTEALDALAPLQGAYPDFTVMLDRDRFVMYQEWDSANRGYSTCWWSGLQSVVTPNGNMWTCVNKREHPAALIGCIADESFDDIWARRPLAKVNADCRVMCRGHLPNRTIEQIMTARDQPHSAFV